MLHPAKLVRQLEVGSWLFIPNSQCIRKSINEFQNTFYSASNEVAQCTMCFDSKKNWPVCSLLKLVCGSYIFRMATPPAQLSAIVEKKSRLTLLFASPCELPIRRGVETETKQKKNARWKSKQNHFDLILWFHCFACKIHNAYAMPLANRF